MTLGPFSGNGLGGGGGAGGINFDPAILVGQAFVAYRQDADTLGKGTGLSESLIVSTHEISTFTALDTDVRTYSRASAAYMLNGDTANNVTLAWTLNRNGDDPADQDINQGIGDVPNADRQVVLAAAGLIATTTWTLSITGDDASYGAAAGNADSANASITFQDAYYYGVDQAVIADGAGVIAMLADPIPWPETLGSTESRTYSFNASVNGGGNYLYIAYPAAWGVPASTTLNGFAFNDYTTVNPTPLTNSVGGGPTNYIILRTNNTYSGAAITWQLL